MERSDEAISREGVFPNGGITVSLRAAGAAIPMNNRKGNNTVVSALIAPLKKAQRKSEGGQLFPVNAERANLLARVCERRYS